jgi:hypothetical protein
MIQFVGDGGRFDEEFIRSVAHPGAHAGRVDDGVDEDIGDVDAERSHFTRDRLGQNTLRRLCRSEAGEVGLASDRRRVSGHQDCALAAPSR